MSTEQILEGLVRRLQQHEGRQQQQKVLDGLVELAIDVLGLQLAIQLDAGRRKEVALEGTEARVELLELEQAIDSDAVQRLEIDGGRLLLGEEYRYTTDLLTKTDADGTRRLLGERRELFLERRHDVVAVVERTTELPR